MLDPDKHQYHQNELIKNLKYTCANFKAAN